MFVVRRNARQNKVGKQHAVKGYGGVLYIGSKRLLALQGTVPGLERAPPSPSMRLRLQCSIDGKQACALRSCTVLKPNAIYNVYTYVLIASARRD